MLGAEDGRAHVGDGLQDHARDLQVRRVGAGLARKGVHVDLVQPRDVPEGDGAPEQRQRGPTPWGPQRSVLVVGRAIVPGAQALAGGSREGARWVVLVHQGQEVRGEG